MTITSPASAENELLSKAIRGVKYTFFKDGMLFYNSGEMLRGTLAKIITVKAGYNRFIISAGKEVEFYQSGAPASGYVAKDANILVGGRTLQFSKEMPIRLFESGAVESGYLAKETRLRIGRNKLLFKRGMEEGDDMSFHPSGRIASGMLAKKSVIRVGKRSLPMVWRIGFYASGKTEWGHLAEDMVLVIGENRLLFAGSEYHNIEFSEAGEVERGYLASAQKAVVGGVPVMLDCNIEFAKGMLVRKGYLAEEFTFRARKFSQFKSVIFSYDGEGKLAGVEQYRHPER